MCKKQVRGKHFSNLSRGSKPTTPSRPSGRRSAGCTTGRAPTAVACSSTTRSAGMALGETHCSGMVYQHVPTSKFWLAIFLGRCCWDCFRRLLCYFFFFWIGAWDHGNRCSTPAHFFVHALILRFVCSSCGVPTKLSLAKWGIGVASPSRWPSSPPFTSRTFRPRSSGKISGELTALLIANKHAPGTTTARRGAKPTELVGAMA